MPSKKNLSSFLFLTVGLLLCLQINQSISAQKLELVVQTGHTDSVKSVAFSPDGKTIASGSHDNTIKLWNVESGKQIKSISGHKSSIFSLAFSPDGKTLATGSDDRTVKLWDVETGQEIKSIDVEIKVLYSVYSVTFSPDGKTLAWGGCEEENENYDCIKGGIKIWDLKSAKEINSFTLQDSVVVSIAFSPDGKIIASGSDDKTIKLLNVETGQIIKSFVGHSDSVRSVTFAPDGIMLVSGSADNSIKLWNVKSGQQIKSLEGHTNSVNSVVFSPNSKILASGSEDVTIKLWDTQTGQQIKSLEGHHLGIESVAFSPDGKTLASGSSDNKIKLWNIEKGQEVESLNGYSNTVSSISYSPLRKTLASGSGNNSIKLWNLEIGQFINSLVGRTDFVYSIVFAPDGKTLASGSSDNTIKLWNIETGQEIKSLKGHEYSVKSVAFSPNGKTLASGSCQRANENDECNKGNIKIWDIKLGTAIKTLVGHTTEVISVAFSPDGKTLASGSRDGIKLWDVQTGQQIKSLISQFSDVGSDVFSPVESVVFSPDGKTLASANYGPTITLWSVKTGKEIKILYGHSVTVTSVTFSPDGKTLASGSADNTVKLWNIETGQQIKSLDKHTNVVDSIVFLPDGKFCVSGSRDGTMKLWNVKTGENIATLISLGKDDWVVIDEDGRFDASDEALKLMHYAYGLQTVDLEQFKDEYFEPGLLRKIFKGERLRAVVPLKDAKLPPDIVSQEFDAKTKRLSVKLKNRGGGFGAIRVFVNDKLAVADARDAKLKANPNTAQDLVELSVDLTGGAFSNQKICETKDGREECRDNKITVYTSNYLAAYKTSNITSRGTSVFTVGGADKDFKLPTLYAIVGGVSDYAGSDLDLRFAAKDAEDFSNALGLGARQLFCAKETPNCLDKVQITTLSTSGKAGTILPTKENFRQAFAEIAAKAEPEDIVLVYLSGHGVSLDDTDTYFYLTQEAASTSKEDLSKNYAKISITSNELLCWMTTTPCDADKTLTFEGNPQPGNKALRQVIILDTCAAGRAGQTLALIAQKDLSTDQRRAIEFLKDKTGTHILMGSTADQPSYEASKFGQGLLTRALLEGMSGAALEKVNGFVDIQTLFRYAETRVEKLAVGIGGIQRPTNAAPTGKTFVIGQMSQTSQTKIAEILPREKPYILRPSFGNREDNYDILGINNQLAKLLNDQNNPLITKGESVMVYINEETFTGAIKPTGFYNVEGETVTVKVSLYRDGAKIGETFEVVGNKNEIAEKLLIAIREKM